MYRPERTHPMRRHVTSGSLLLTILFCLTALSTSPGGEARAAIDAIYPSSYSIGKAAAVVSDRTRSVLPNREGSIARVWVYFTDKKVFDARGFQSAAASVALSSKVLARRAKTGTDKIMFLDLPVVEDYVGAVKQLGATLRRESRWLNAASFDMTMAQLDQVAALPFVAEIKPVAGYFRPADPVVPAEPRPPQQKSSGSTENNYGNSFGQLNLMGVPAAHAAGYNGQGVTLAIFDAGFRKTHEVFASAVSGGRIIGEYNFVFNVVSTAPQPGDDPNSWSHGTSTWPLAGGFKDGTLYGGAYKANFILAKTEDTRSEHHIEEDNWVAALQWADSLGADVVTSSLGYFTFDSPDTSYTYSDMNGMTAICSKAASTADSLGIVVCNSMGNSGPGVGTITAPADAFKILAVGAVSSSGTIASFSSRGPTFDGRIKPEICAQGINTWVASSSSDISYSPSFSGTSAACPLAAGATVLLVQARPTWPPALIRQAIQATASRAATPDNNYGWGIINVNAALSWGVNFTENTTQGLAPLTVQFTDSSQLAVSSRLWDFGDGNTSTAVSPSHTYLNAGNYTVTLTGQTTYGAIVRQKVGLIAALGDTLFFGTDSVFAGHQVVKSVRLKNSQPLVRVVVPFKIATSPLRVTLDSITAGSRTLSYPGFAITAYDQFSNRFSTEIDVDTTLGQLPIPAGDGEVLRLYLSDNALDLGGLGNTVDSAIIAPYTLQLNSPEIIYSPTIVPGVLATKTIKRGDLNRDFRIDLGDLSYLVSYLTSSGAQLLTIQSADWNGDQTVNLGDLTSMVSYLTTGLPLPVNP